MMPSRIGRPLRVEVIRAAVRAIPATNFLPPFPSFFLSFPPHGPAQLPSSSIFLFSLLPPLLLSPSSSSFFTCQHLLLSSSFFFFLLLLPPPPPLTSLYHTISLYTTCPLHLLLPQFALTQLPNPLPNSLPTIAPLATIFCGHHPTQNLAPPFILEAATQFTSHTHTQQQQLTRGTHFPQSIATPFFSPHSTAQTAPCNTEPARHTPQTYSNLQRES